MASRRHGNGSRQDKASRQAVRRGRFVLPLLMLLACAVAAPGAWALFGPSGPGGNKGAEHKQIQQLEQQWQTSVLAGDTASMAALIAESYVGIGPDGTIASKSEELEARANGQERLEKYDRLDQKIRIYGTTAVVTSRVRIEGVYSGQPLLGEYRYTRVWSLLRGQWRIVSFEASRIHDASERR